MLFLFCEFNVSAVFCVSRESVTKTKKKTNNWEPNVFLFFMDLFINHFLKLFFILENKTKNIENMFDFHVFFSKKYKKNIKNITFKITNKSFQITPWVFYLFSKTILNNSF